MHTGRDTKVPGIQMLSTPMFRIPFSNEIDTGDKILLRGMGLRVLPVPVHRLNLDCAFVQGEVPVGVRPALPVAGVDMIFGNELAGSRVWANMPAP